MGLTYDSAESSSLTSALTANLAAASAVLDATQSASDRLITALGQGDLSGEGYSAVDALFGMVIAPCVAQAKSDIGTIQGELDQYTAHDSDVSRYGVLKEDELNKQLVATKKQRDATERQIEAHRDARDVATIPGMLASTDATIARLETVLNQLDNDIRDLEDRLAALRAFAAATKGLFLGRLESLAASTGDTIAVLKQLNQPFDVLPVPLLGTSGTALGALATRRQILDFLAEGKIAKDAKGRLMWRGRYLYDPARQQLSRRGKAFDKATGSQLKDYKRPLASGGKAALKAPIEDFTGWKAASTVGKLGKGVGAAGTLLSIGANADEYFSNGVQGLDVPDFAVDTGVDLASAAAAAGAGAAIGSIFIPPAGTVIGALVGAGLSAIIDLTGASDAAKDAIKKTYR